MAISVTQILGTDSLSGSRIVINDNFNIVASEINAILNYVSPQASTISNLSSLTTESLTIGAQAPIATINQNVFSINRPVTINNNDLTLNGGNLIRNNQNSVPIDENTGTGPIEIGTSTAPPEFTTELVSNNDNDNTLTLTLNDGNIGQEIYFIYNEPSTGAVEIFGVNSNLVLGSSNAKIVLNGLGQSVHLLAINDGTGNCNWYIVGGNGYNLE